VLKLARLIHAGLIALAMVSLGGLGAAAAGPTGQNTPAPGDDREQTTNATLNPQAEKVSRANALYADALGHDAAGDQQGALKELRQVVELDPQFIDAQVRLGNLLLDLKQPDAALAQLKAAAAANPGSSAIAAALGKVEHAMDHKDTAQSESEAVLAKDPTQTASMQVLLEIGADQHALEPALQRVTGILKSAHAPVASYLALVKIYLDITGKEDPQPTGDVIQQALLPVYQTAVKQAPPSVDLLSVLADTYHDLGQKEEAFAVLRQALVVEPGNIEMILRCATLAGELGNKKEEMVYYEKAYTVNPNQDGLREDMVRSYYENQLFAKALTMMKQMLTNSPDDSMLELRIGVTCEGLHQEKQAQMWFQKALAAPNCPLDPYLKMAAYYIDLQRIKEAGDVLAEGTKRFPDSAQLRFYQAVQYQDAKNAAAAMQSLDEARKLAGDPSTLGVNFYLESAAIMAAAGRRGEIEPMLSEGLQKFPDDPNILNQQAWEWADEGVRLPDALATAQHAATLAPDNGSIQDTLGCVYVKMGKPNDALPYLQQAVKMTNNDPSVLQHLGDAYLGLDRKTEALTAWRLGLQKDPDNHELKHRIETTLASANHAPSRSAP
jgi:tetratricopeptide (TPR) repeat protein